MSEYEPNYRESITELTQRQMERQRRWRISESDFSQGLPKSAISTAVRYTERVIERERGACPPADELM